MKLPAIIELRKIHIFVFSYPIRVLFVPSVLYLILFGSMTTPLGNFDQVENAGNFFCQLPFRLLFGVVFMPLCLLAGSLEI